MNNDQLYNSKVEEQIRQYAQVEDMHAALGNINTYWKQEHHAPRFRKATGSKNHVDFYAGHLVEGAKRSGFFRIASLGSGNAAVEIEIAKHIESLGIQEYEFYLIELSSFQNERAMQQVEKCKLKGRFLPQEIDLNNWSPSGKFSGVMAHHSLHHILDLERVFDQVQESLSDHGCFVTFDIIGRNGHQRWPETYAIVNALWHYLPIEKRRHNVLGWLSSDYKDHDCSTQGFEGIRSQDILRLLIERFSFGVFFPWGGITDVFTGRAYGPNFNPELEEDRRLIDLVDELNEALIDIGAIKPTNICAALYKHEAASEPRLYKNRSPENMIRIV